MSSRKEIRFSEVAPNERFSPANGTAGSQFVYIKKGLNGICPRLGAPEDSADSAGIFYPSDRVVVLSVQKRT